jgi:FkbM family methyltransferase
MKKYYDCIINKTSILPKKILEIGSRDGNDAHELMGLFNLQDKDVWVVEPNPNQVEDIKKKYPYFNIIPYAIFNEETEHDFYQVNSSKLDEIGTSSLINRNDKWYDTKTKIIRVQTITGKQLLDKIKGHVDICKIDVEGVTYEVLNSFEDQIKKIKSFHLECEHKQVWKEQKLYNDVFNFLIKNNYTQIYFEYCSGSDLQSDSIWVLNEFLKS